MILRLFCCCVQKQSSFHSIGTGVSMKNGINSANKQLTLRKKAQIQWNPQCASKIITSHTNLIPRDSFSTGQQQVGVRALGM